MKINLTLELSERDRYVIAKYYATNGTRASREFSKRFVRAAVASGIREQADALNGRQRKTAKRLADAKVTQQEPLREPREKQLNLLGGVV